LYSTIRRPNVPAKFLSRVISETTPGYSYQGKLFYPVNAHEIKSLSIVI